MNGIDAMMMAPGITRLCNQFLWRSGAAGIVVIDDILAQAGTSIQKSRDST